MQIQIYKAILKAFKLILASEAIIIIIIIIIIILFFLIRGHFLFDHMTQILLAGKIKFLVVLLTSSYSIVDVYTIFVCILPMNIGCKFSSIHRKER